ncbi:MAG TPA: SPOR domain-containing protein [Steroidobacteraceae bacterium]|jgi:cell division protein FtsN|nr:SPOR domain-containing protein [Steroidobacteraceae bacterium]
MARDYKPKRKRPAPGFSGWVGVACGLAAGLALAAAVYIKDHRPDAADAAPSPRSAAKIEKRKPRGGDSGDGADAGTQGDSAKSYAFYDMLPKFEVVVPEKDKDVRPDTRAVPETRSGTYVLQAGSYKNFADADRVRAKLALQGVESKVQKVSVDNDTWHRIRIGPISKLDELNRLRSILRKADVDVLVIRVGD